LKANARATDARQGSPIASLEAWQGRIAVAQAGGYHCRRGPRVVSSVGRFLATRRTGLAGPGTPETAPAWARGGGRRRYADFRTQSGIYILYDDYGPMYVGAVWNDRLGDRLREHLNKRDLGGKWNRFSWFGFRRVRSTNDDLGIYPLGGSVRRNKSMPISSNAAIGDIEALVIKAFGLKNVRPAVFRGKVQWKQVTREKAEEFLKERRSAKPRGSKTAG
jgi:hypothetical protein